MPKISMEVPHALSTEEARGRLERKADSLLGSFANQVKDLSHSWAGNLLSFGFKTMGLRFDGTVDVQEDKVVVNSDLPFAAMMFKGKIESEIRQQLERTLRA